MVEMTKSDSQAARKREWPTEVREIIAVFVLSVTAILTAWCGFESSKWSGEMSIQFSQASADRIKSSDMASEARDAQQVDLAIYTQWVDARAAGNKQLESYVAARFTPEFRVAFDVWQNNNEALKSPFAEPSYVPAGQVQSSELSGDANKKFSAALVSNQRGDNYSLLTVLFALVLFFSAMSSRNRYPWVDWFLLGLAVVIAIGGAIILSTFPILV
jgi:hypothetical protein